MKGVISRGESGKKREGRQRDIQHFRKKAQRLDPWCLWYYGTERAKPVGHKAAKAAVEEKVHRLSPISTRGKGRQGTRVAGGKR